MKPLLLFLFLFSGSFITHAQSKAPTEKTLLWRISGKGLTRPSYLFGTMHLTDERLFNFSDSLLSAIEKADGFAMEVDPDEMITVIMEEMFNDIKRSPPLKEVVSPKAYTKYGPLLSKRIKKPVENITVKDVMQEQNKWMRDVYKNGAMPTFVDAWLYDIARKKGKWVGGIEDVEDQKGLLESLFTEQDLEFLTADYSDNGKAYLKSMIDSYVKQDIESIENFSSIGDGHRKDLLLLKRNVKMARRMDSLSAIRSMVFAVGAAHLPGDSGVISLLRQKGFDVQPVFGSKTIAAKNYELDVKPIAWKKFAEANGLYEVEMPGKASPLKMYGVLEMRMNIDLFTSSGYLTMAIPSTIGLKNPDSALLEMGRKMLLDDKLKQGKPIVQNGIKGREYTSHNNDGYKRVQIFTNGEILYLACVFFPKEEGLQGDDAKHFFSSLTLHEASGKPDSWVSLSGIYPGIEGYSPVTFEPNKQMAEKASEAGWETNAYTGIDVKTGSFYMLLSKSTINDTYIPADSVYLAIVRGNTRVKTEKFDIDTIRIVDGNYMLEQEGIYKENMIHYHLKSFVKGNRNYTLFIFLEDKKENRQMATKVMETFKMVAPPASTWSLQQSAVGRFKTWAPNKFVMHIDTSDNANNKTASFNVKDTNTNYLYSVVKSPFDSATWYNGQDDYWKVKLKDYETTTDTVLSSREFNANGLHGYDLQVRVKTSEHKIKLIRIFAYGDTLYTMFGSLPAVDKDDPDVKRFFSDFSFNYPQPVTTVFTSKAPAYLSRLNSSDSATHATAFYGIQKASFTKADIPFVRQALLLHYDWDTVSNYYSPSQIKLGDKLQSLGDSTIDEFIKTNYAQRGGRDDEEQTSLLYSVVSKPTVANLRFVVDALKQVDGSSVIATDALYHFADSLPLVKTILPDVLSLLNKPNMTDAMLDFSQVVLDSNLVQPAALLPSEKSILAFGKNKLKEINAGKSGDGYSLRSVAFVAGRLKTAPGIAFLKEMLASKNNSVKQQAINGLLEAGEPLSALELLTVAADAPQRLELRETLKKFRKEMLFPTSYLNQQSFAEAEIVDYLSGEDIEIESSQINYISTQKTIIAGELCNLYFFRVNMDAGTKDQTLCVAAFPAGVKKLEAISNGISVNWKETYTAKNKEAQVKVLIEKLKENEKE